ncbi:MAG: hypothetical protein E3J72_20770 [Planctomycetota bacterium]|nr:MAG: hypothetical protein E3J72_20770 [Planctomycetota bacterium]
MKFGITTTVIVVLVFFAGAYNSTAFAAQSETDARHATEKLPELHGNESPGHGISGKLRPPGSIISRLNRSPHRRKVDKTFLRFRLRRTGVAKPGVRFTSDHRSLGPQLPTITEQTLRAHHARLRTARTVVTILLIVMLTGMGGIVIFIIIERRYPK